MRKPKNAQLVVLIPHFNNPAELNESVRSISESIPVDVLVVDDGSQRPPDKKSLSEEYTQGAIFFLDLPENKGIEHALNAGLEWIAAREYPYIGRLDCGDLNLTGKYEKQLSFLDANPSVGLLGTWVEVVDTHGRHLFDLKHPASHEAIRKRMYLNSMFVHPTVVFRRAVLEVVPSYPVNFKAAEDYAFFFEILKHFRVANLPEVLLRYQMDPKSISSTKRKLQVRSRLRVILKHFSPGWYPLYGLIRNFVLLFVSRDTTTFLKKYLAFEGK